MGGPPRKSVLPVLAVAALGMLGAVTTTRSETSYIVDTVVVPMRAAPGEDAPILARLVSGDPVVRLDEVAGSYVKISLPDRREGWVDSRYLTSEPVARRRLEEITEQYGDLHEQLELRQSARDAAEQSLVRLSDDYERLSEELERLRKASLQPD
jgi:SH3 domain protein